MTLTIKKSEKRKPVGVCDKKKSATAILTALVLLLTIQRSVSPIRKVWRHYNVIRSRKSKKNKQHNGQKNKQRSTKHYTEN